MESQRRAAALILAMASALLLVLMLAACSVTPGGESGRLQQLAQECPDAPLATLVALDVSGSQNSARISDDGLAVVRDQAQLTSLCGGELRVVAFAVNSSETQTVYTGNVTAEAPTDIARYKRVPRKVSEVVDAVSAAYPQAVVTLPRSGSDINAIFGLAAEYGAQVDASTGVKHVLNAVVVTDGLQTVGDVLTDPALTVDQAATMAAAHTPYALDGALVTVAGVGRTSGDLLPTATIDALKRYFTDLLSASGAARVTVVTDYVAAG